MFEMIFACAVFSLGLFLGAMSNVAQITVNEVNLANARCGINGDLSVIRVHADGSKMAKCTNGAEFDVKEKK